MRPSSVTLLQLLLLSAGAVLLAPVDGGRDGLSSGARGLTTAGEEGGEVVLDVRMPGITTTSMNEYHCLNVDLPDEPLNLVGIESLSDRGLVHHMLLYGCKEPSQVGPVYKCGMQTKGTCKNAASAPLYGWGSNAPMVRYPQGVGVQVGPGTHIQMLVLEIHYLQIVTVEDKSSGVRLRLSRNPQEHAGGLVSLAAFFQIPPGEPSYVVPMECCVNSMMPVRGFAMRAHTHALGRSVKLAHNLRNGTLQQVVDQDPQEPQGFYPLAGGDLTLPRGSKLEASCTFNSTTRTTPTRAGYGHNDEMCNAYLMLHSELPFYSICSHQPPTQAAGNTPMKEDLPLQRSTDWKVLSSSLGQVAGVEAAEGGRLWIFHRGSRVWDANSYTQLTHVIRYDSPIQEECILEVDRDSGAVLRSWGRNIFYMPHGLTVDQYGDLWLTDTGLHQVFKYSPNGTLLMELGVKLEPGHSERHFCMPTQVAVALAGDFYVADGYCNSRIMHFNADGTFRREVGHRLDHPMRLPHSLVLDECHDVILVADRLNSMVRAFHISTGHEQPKLSMSVAKFGHPYALTAGPYGSIFVLLWKAPGESFVARLDISVRINFSVFHMPASWEISSYDVYADAPHDIALIPGAHLTDRVEERPIVVFVADTLPVGGGRLSRFDWQALHDPFVGEDKWWIGSKGVRADGGTTLSVTSPARLQGRTVGVGPTDEDGEPEILLRDKVDLRQAVGELYMYGVPTGLVFAGIAVLLWRRLGDMQPH